MRRLEVGMTNHVQHDELCFTLVRVAREESEECE